MPSVQPCSVLLALQIAKFSFGHHYVSAMPYPVIVILKMEEKLNL
jgi:hypothetical protein